MKKLFIILFIGIAGITNGFSQTKQELIKELFKVMQQDSLMEKSFSAMIPAMMKQMQGQNKDSAAVARSQEVMKATIPVMRDILKNMMNEDMVGIYDKYFEENDLKDIIAFYKTPSGQKFLRTQPEIQKELMPIMFQKYVPQISRAMKEKMEELKAKENK